MTRQFTLVKADAFNTLKNASAADLPSLLASTDAHVDGEIISTRAEGHSYKVVGGGGDIKTAGGIHLRVLPNAHNAIMPEQFGADGTGATICTAEFQSFLDAVVRFGYRGIARGLYRIDDTVNVNNAFVDGKTDFVLNARGFYLTIGQAADDQSGLYYVGEGGTGPDPHQVKPAINLHNLNYFQIGNICVTNEIHNEKRFTCGIRWTSSNNNQRGNADIDLLYARGFERGIVVGLNEYYPDLSFDCWEKVNIRHLKTLQCRHDFYMSCATTDGWKIGHVECVAYNTSGNGPKFHMDDVDGTRSEIIFEIERSGGGTIEWAEVAQHDMLLDGSGVVMSFGVIYLKGATFEVTNAYQLRQTNSMSFRNAPLISNVRTSDNGFGEEGRACWFVGNVRVVNSNFAGKIRALRAIEMVNTSFYSDVDPATLDIEETFFDLYGDLKFGALNISGLRCQTTAQAFWENFAFNQFANLSIKKVSKVCEKILVGACAATVVEVGRDETVELTYFVENSGTPVSTGKILLTRISTTMCWSMIHAFSETPEIEISVDESDALNGNFVVNVTNNLDIKSWFIAYEAMRGIRA